jgi:hypothetical protein
MKTMNIPTMKLGAAATCLAFATCASAGTMMSKSDYQAARKTISDDATTAKAKCKAFVANAKDICMAEAKGNEKVALAQLEESYKPSDKTRQATRVAQADATHAVAKEKCDDATGNAKDVCVKEANAAHANAVAEAKAKHKIADAKTVANDKTKTAKAEASGKVVDARTDVNAEKREGAYSVAKQKCDAQVGDKKDACLRDAKAAYDKS